MHIQLFRPSALFRRSNQQHIGGVAADDTAVPACCTLHNWNMHMGNLHALAHPCVHLDSVTRARRVVAARARAIICYLCVRARVGANVRAWVRVSVCVW